jgi:hypothetical protein
LIRSLNNTSKEWVANNLISDYDSLIDFIPTMEQQTVDLSILLSLISKLLKSIIYC